MQKSSAQLAARNRAMPRKQSKKLQAPAFRKSYRNYCRKLHKFLPHTSLLLSQLLRTSNKFMYIKEKQLKSESSGSSGICVRLKADARV
jgi:hypothetical protein